MVLHMDGKRATQNKGVGREGGITALAALLLCVMFRHLCMGLSQARHFVRGWLGFPCSCAPFPLPQSLPFSSTLPATTPVGPRSAWISERLDYPETSHQKSCRMEVLHLCNFFFFNLYWFVLRWNEIAIVSADKLFLCAACFEYKLVTIRGTGLYIKIICISTLLFFFVVDQTNAS